MMDLGSFHGDKVELEKKVNSIYTNKEKRDRIGFIISSVVANIHPRYEEIGEEEKSSTKMKAVDRYPYSKLFKRFESLEKQKESEDGEGDKLNED